MNLNVWLFTQQRCVQIMINIPLIKWPLLSRTAIILTCSYCNVTLGHLATLIAIVIIENYYNLAQSIFGFAGDGMFL